MAVQLLRRSFTADEYHRMVQAGILTEDDRLAALAPAQRKSRLAAPLKDRAVLKL